MFVAVCIWRAKRGIKRRRAGLKSPASMKKKKFYLVAIGFPPTNQSIEKSVCFICLLLYREIVMEV